MVHSNTVKPGITQRKLNLLWSTTIPDLRHLLSLLHHNRAVLDFWREFLHGLSHDSSINMEDLVLQIYVYTVGGSIFLPTYSVNNIRATASCVFCIVPGNRLENKWITEQNHFVWLNSNLSLSSRCPWCLISLFFIFQNNMQTLKSNNPFPFSTTTELWSMDRNIQSNYSMDAVSWRLSYSLTLKI